jgi:hypothetical protein
LRLLRCWLADALNANDGARVAWQGVCSSHKPGAEHDTLKRCTWCQ